MPSKYNQMSAIRTSDIRKSGRAAHAVTREWLNPRITLIQSGAVWTM